ncbi:aminotransferase class I/II-fold pyridoxal phosphate-dependent enzyme [Algoriphagus halophytocola]|uniref:Aminotransferase n=1 Tax=Algoriphagus halophytocola TaxID=2991499 RepID=A0ABY6MJZ1_9BACT|nr:MULTISPECIES: aminotransferase class I/II-fold pyridoxal phosphate-dependent enzyme [unclassified Algoriphagus]UZD22732.1 aminotransferase class I/II-fold pyridoxal phosphate-dependent enzyme [Algoriphagus sp. TR-M5]WBL43997.1 aminotransferase class I/II-fold pyridoxal phosphate-dependent enzyme [Algoriphagus sp. TR-M9]
MKGFADRVSTVEEYYFSAKLREVNQMIAEGKPIINLGIGSPDLAPDKLVTEALKNTADNPQAHGYQSYQGIPELRTAISNFYSRAYGVSLDPSKEILPMMGSKEGIMHLSLTFLNPGDEVLVPNPGYPTYTSVCKLVGAKPIYYSIDLEKAGRPNFEEIENQDLSKVKIMWINYPHMPTGAPGSKTLMQELVTFAKKHEIVLLHDNPYSHILTKEPLSILSIPEAKEVALELNSLSKAFNMPGWRVGMLTGREDWISKVLKVKSNMDSGMFLGIQKGAIAALNLGESWFADIESTYQSRRKLVWKLADKLGLTYDEKAAGLFVWCKVPEGKTADQIVDELLYERYIFITPGKIFGSDGNDYVRFSLCMPEFKILEAINRIK